MDLRTARILSNKTQVDLKKLTGIYDTRISAIENGRVLPSSNEKRKLEKALNLEGAIQWDDCLLRKRH